MAWSQGHAAVSACGDVCGDVNGSSPTADVGTMWRWCRLFWMSLKCSIDDLYSLVRLVLAIILCMVGLDNFLLSVILQVHAGAVFVVLPYGCILSGPHLVGRNTVDVSLDLSVMELPFFQWQHVRREPLLMP